MEVWLKGDPDAPTPPIERFEGRNKEWMHLFNRDIVSMPDKWEYPWVRGGREGGRGGEREGGRERRRKERKKMILKECIFYLSLSLSSYSMLHGI